MLRVGTQKLGELREGTQKIKEAWVGVVKVFSSFSGFIGELLQGKNWAIQPISDKTDVLGGVRVWDQGYDEVIFEKGQIGGRSITSSIKLSKDSVTSRGLSFELYDGDTLIESKTNTTKNGSYYERFTVTFDRNISGYSLHIVGYQMVRGTRIFCEQITIS